MLKNVSFPRVSITEDFTPKVSLARSKNYIYASQYRTRNIRFKLSLDKLYVNIEVYVYGHAHCTLKQLSNHQVTGDAHQVLSPASVRASKRDAVLTGSFGFDTSRNILQCRAALEKQERHKDQGAYSAYYAEVAIL